MTGNEWIPAILISAAFEQYWMGFGTVGRGRPISRLLEIVAGMTD